jgi:hypothetical protein
VEAFYTKVPNYYQECIFEEIPSRVGRVLIMLRDSQEITTQEEETKLIFPRNAFRRTSIINLIYKISALVMKGGADSGYN